MECVWIKRKMAINFLHENFRVYLFTPCIIPAWQTTRMLAKQKMRIRYSPLANLIFPLTLIDL